MNTGDQLSSQQTSEANSQSHGDRSITNPDRARVFVRLSNGTKCYVPVAQTATIHDLHDKSLQRAAKFGFQANLKDTFLQTTGASAVALYGEDSVSEVLDLTGSSTFDLCLLEDHSLQSPASSATQVRPMGYNKASTNEAVVWIRWITLEAAISHTRLSAIQTDRSAVPRDTTLAQFHNIAVARFEAPNFTGRARAQRVNLFLKECRLSAKNNSMSLHDLKLSGSKEAPLDIFVDLDTSEVGNNGIADLTENTNVKSLWGFETTKRGICTLTTSLKMLIKEIKAGSYAMNKILGILFELTHFPPLLIAFVNLQKTDLEERRCSLDLRLFASALHILCLQIAPSSICPSPEMALESSRQVVAWLLSLEPGNTLNAGKVQIKSKTDEQLLLTGLLPYKYDVDVAVTKDYTSSNCKQLVVALDKEEERLAALLGRAIYEDFSCQWDFYLHLETWTEVVNHKKLQAVQPTGFDNLLHITASSKKFRMVGPLELGSCLATELPVITLSSAGYVSLYDQEDYECSEK